MDVQAGRGALLRSRWTTIQTATANPTLTTARTVWTALKPAPRVSSPQMFQIRVPHTHTVHRQKARMRLACPLVIVPPEDEGDAGAGAPGVDGWEGSAGVSITPSTVSGGGRATTLT